MDIIEIDFVGWLAAPIRMRLSAPTRDEAVAALQRSVATRDAAFTQATLYVNGIAHDRWWKAGDKWFHIDWVGRTREEVARKADGGAGAGPQPRSRRAPEELA